MSKKVFIIIGVILASSGALFAVTYYYRHQNTTPQNTPPPVNQAVEAAPKLGVKQFNFASQNNSKVSGDGSMTLKTNLTSLAVRLAEAPVLTGGDVYAVYVRIKRTSDLVYIGTLTPSTANSTQFLFGIAGPLAWYDAERLVITKQNSVNAPGVIVAEAKIPNQGSESK